MAWLLSFEFTACCPVEGWRTLRWVEDSSNETCRQQEQSSKQMLQPLPEYTLLKHVHTEVVVAVMGRRSQVSYGFRSSTE